MSADSAREPSLEGAFDISLPEMVVAKLLSSRARDRGEHPFVMYGDEPWTFRAVEDAAAALAAAFRSRGVERGTAVGLFLSNRSEFVNSYFALSKLGAITVPINTAYRGYMLEYVLTDSACQVLVVEDRYRDQFAPSIAKLRDLKMIVVVDAGEELPSFDDVEVVRFEEMLAAAGSAFDDDESCVSYEDTNCVIYTSGTTGPSKGVVIPNSASVFKAFEFIRATAIVEDDRIHAPLPLFHSFALLRGVLTALVAGCTCALRERFSASRYWDDIREMNATVAFVVFSMPAILAKAPVSVRDRDHSVRCMISAHYDPAFEERFGVRLLEGYSLTEGGLAIYGRVDEPRRPGSCGRASDEWDVRVFDEDDREVAAGVEGELVMRPRVPGIMSAGYLNKAEATVALLRNLWLHTGDLATTDPDGFFYFRGRKKDAIRRRGENISAWEVEQVLLEHQAISDAAAIPYPSPLGEDDVRVVIELRDAEALTAEELLSFCRERLPDFMVPRYIEFRAELPRTPNGKVEKYRLRDEGLAADCFDRGDPREISRR